VKVVLMLAVWWLSTQASRIFRQKPDPARMADNLQRFSRQVSQSALLGIGLMAAVAILVQTQPPTSPPPTSPNSDTAFHDLLKADDLLAHIYISPAQPGDNQYMVRLFHEDGSSIGDVQLVRMYFDSQQAEIGQSSLVLDQRGSEIFGGAGPYINRAGLWKLSLYVRRRGLDDTLVDFNLDIQPPAGLSQNSHPFQNPVTTIPVNGLLAAGMIVLGAEILRWRKTLQQVQPNRFRLWMALSGGMIISGAMLGIWQLIQLILK
jgi:copper transport protein